MSQTLSFSQLGRRLRTDGLDFWARRMLRLHSTRQAWYAGEPLKASDVARLARISRAVRGLDGPRVAVLHGVMPRSGTNYLYSLLGLHPDVVTDPLGIRELPLLASAPAAREWQDRFMEFYQGNREAMGDLDMLAYAVNGMMAHAAREHAGAKLILFKVPHTRYLSYFPALFPDDRCIILLRDGKRTVQSTIATWPLKPFGKSFADICLEWTYATDAALDYWTRADKSKTLIDRYEDVTTAPHEHVRHILEFLGLDAARYPFDEIAALPVLGSSELSRDSGAVSWEPVTAGADFNPARRRIEWPQSWRRTFRRLSARTMQRAGYNV
jgi:protein-tyrosine sulfotransferase